MSSRIRTIAELNKHNKRRNRIAKIELSKWLKNEEIAELAALKLHKATISGALFNQSEPQTVFGLIKQASLEVNSKNGSSARQRNARLGRKKIHQIGPLAPCSPFPYRLRRTVAGFIFSLIDGDLKRDRLKTLYKGLREPLRKIADNQDVRLCTRTGPKSRSTSKSHSDRRSTYDFSVDGAPYNISFSQVERIYRDVRKRRQFS